ncbi:hypothetical protein [Paraburkholderia atlantica]|uniref:hypothetical protein n=1 Tax=Paraburkholderia atlantica TaxID=2654982 RepID=UPI0001BF1A3D|nr:hypothetical protein [Paraburkholderia atlantica]
MARRVSCPSNRSIIDRESVLIGGGAAPSSRQEHLMAMGCCAVVGPPINSNNSLHGEPESSSVPLDHRGVNARAALDEKRFPASAVIIDGFGMML